MSDPQQRITGLFKTLLTDPKAAEAALLDWSDNENERAALRSCAAQQAIIAGFTEPPKPAQVRAIASRLRRALDEPIDSFAIATIIDSVFHPESPAVNQRMLSIDQLVLRRMIFLLPHGIYIDSTASDADIHGWAERATAHFMRAGQLLLDDYGPDWGEFYWTLCTNPLAAYQVIERNDDIPHEHKRTMVFNAAFGALNIMFAGQRPTPDERAALIERMQHLHGDFSVEGLDNLIHGCFETTDWPDHPERYTVAFLMPSTMIDHQRMGGREVIDFVRRCKQHEDTVVAEAALES